MRNKKRNKSEKILEVDEFRTKQSVPEWPQDPVRLTAISSLIVFCFSGGFFLFCFFVQGCLNLIRWSPSLLSWFMPEKLQQGLLDPGTDTPGRAGPSWDICILNPKDKKNVKIKKIEGIRQKLRDKGNTQDKVTKTKFIHKDAGVSNQGGADDQCQWDKTQGENLQNKTGNATRTTTHPNINSKLNRKAKAQTETLTAPASSEA